MTRRKVFCYICLLTCILFIVTHLSQNSFSFSVFPFSLVQIFFSSKITFPDRVDLNIITNQSFNCIQTKLLLNKYRTTVCVHEVKQDRDVSGLLISSGIWEENLVTHIVRILSIYKQYAFFDIGANIGIYSTGQNYKNKLVVSYSLFIALSAKNIFYCNSLSNIDFDLLFQNILRRCLSIK
jgi:hypothetical protein